MKSSPLLLLAMIAWLAGSPVAAQESKSAPPLSLKDCLDIALKNQVDVQVAQNSVEAAKQRSKQAKSTYFPQLSIQNNAFNIGSEGVLTQRNTGTAIIASQNIYDGGLRETRVSGARFNETANQAGLSRTVQQVAFNVTRAYYEVLRSKHLSDVSAASVKYNEELKQVIQSRIELGDAAKTDVLPVEAQLANSNVSLLSAQNDVQLSLVRLQNAMGLSPQAGFDVKDVDGQPEVKLDSVDTYMTAAVSNRPDVRESEAQLGASKASVKSARISIYPVPEIAGEYQTGFGRASGSSVQVFGGIRLGIFNGGSNRAAYREARANEASAQSRSRQVVKDIQADVQAAYLNLNAASERLKASKIGSDAAQNNYEVQQAKYTQGLGTTLDMLNAEVQMVTAQTNLVEARYDLYIAIAEMDLAVGKDGGFNAN